MPELPGILSEYFNRKSCYAIRVLDYERLDIGRLHQRLVAVDAELEVGDGHPLGQVVLLVLGLYRQDIVGHTAIVKVVGGHQNLHAVLLEQLLGVEVEVLVVGFQVYDAIGRHKLSVAVQESRAGKALLEACLLYTSDAADDMQCVDLGGRRFIEKKKKKKMKKERSTMTKVAVDTQTQ
eukprot:TRINITY_DN12050_c0_g1_i1.p3 TRINITY_DN12050_c0_g1~~TRINITY_DN12050_c0_g1_i1.p3  ORF type:complete len:179 (-),score=7.15 TRINITY_DN12050_c0_g1_i1:11-547(-)